MTGTMTVTNGDQNFYKLYSFMDFVRQHQVYNILWRVVIKTMECRTAHVKLKLILNCRNNEKIIVFCHGLFLFNKAHIYNMQAWCLVNIFIKNTEKYFYLSTLSQYLTSEYQAGVGNNFHKWRPDSHLRSAFAAFSILWYNQVMSHWLCTTSVFNMLKFFENIKRPKMYLIIAILWKILNDTDTRYINEWTILWDVLHIRSILFN